MPLIGSNPWLGAAQVGEGIGSSLGQMMLQVPQIRAHLAYQQQQIALQQQQAQMEQQRLNLQAPMWQAHTKLYEAQARNVGRMNPYDQAKLDAAKGAGQAFMNAYMATQHPVSPEIGPPNPQDQQASAMGQALQQFMQVAGLHGTPQMGTQAGAQMLGTMQNVNNPAGLAVMAGQRPYMNISPGGTAFDMMGGANFTAPTTPQLDMARKAAMMNALTHYLGLTKMADEPMDKPQMDAGVKSFMDLIGRVTGQPITNAPVGGNIKSIRPK
jgi:hypothetical protein